LHHVIREILVKIKIMSQVPEAHTCNPGYSGGRDKEDLHLTSAPTKSDPYISKIPNAKKRAGGVVQVVENLPSKLEALSSNPTKKN
jgi:hypothetical protein